jgi:alkylmercury lyase
MEKLDLNEIIRLIPNEFLKLTLEEQMLSVQLYRLLAEGQPVSTETLAKALNFPMEAVNNILEKWVGVYSNEEKQIIGYWGLALPQMPHRFTVKGNTLYTWCAWDSLFIPEIIKKTARVESTCPVTGSKIALTVTPEEIKELEPPGTVMSFVTPEAGKIRENVILNFCHYIHFFSSAEAGSKWISHNQGTLVLSLAEAFDLGQKKNEIRYKDVLNGTAL